MPRLRRARDARNPRQGRPAEALESYRRAAEADPAYAEAHVAAGMPSEGLGKLPESMSDYDAAAGPAGARGQSSRARARALKRQNLRGMDDLTRHIRHSNRGETMTAKGDTTRQRPLSPAEIKAWCDRDLEEQRREFFEEFDREVDEDIARSIDRSLELNLEESLERSRERSLERSRERIFSIMD